MIAAALLAALALSSPQKLPHPSGKLPAGTHWGRCLLVVSGQTRINGRCSYSISKGGAFHIDGPRHAFDGIDYPKADSMAAMISTDYWANVSRDGDAWGGSANSDLRSVHGEDLGVLRRQGACYLGRRVKVCLWAK